MYSCEKLARGIIPQEEKTSQKRNLEEILPITIKDNKHKYNYNDARKYCVELEKNPNRAKGKIYRSKKR